MEKDGQPNRDFGILFLEYKARRSGITNKDFQYRLELAEEKYAAEWSQFTQHNEELISKIDSALILYEAHLRLMKHWSALIRKYEDAEAKEYFDENQIQGKGEEVDELLLPLLQEAREKMEALGIQTELFE